LGVKISLRPNVAQPKHLAPCTIQDTIRDDAEAGVYELQKGGKQEWRAKEKAMTKVSD